MARPPVNASCSIFVGNVPYDAQEEDLREIFGRVGTVTSVRVVCDKDTKQPKGYAFCDFTDSASVQAAIDKLSNVEYHGRRLRIDCAERELHTPLPARGAGGDDDRGPGPPARRGGGGVGGPSSVMDSAPLPPVQTAADRLARLRDQEAAEQARVAAAAAAERAEIARLMETLTPQQVMHILGETQRLALRAPEVARALIGENMQLALALQHAEFLAGMIDEAPLPTDPEVRERARSVREKVWGTSQAPAPPPRPPPGQAPGQPPGVRPPQVPAPVPPPGALALAAPSALAGAALAGAALAAPGAVLPFGGHLAFAPPGPAPAGQRPPPGAAAMPVEAARGAPQASSPAPGASPSTREGLMERLVHMSPVEIDRLPHQTKVQLLDFLQRMPAPA